jgi:hypothetical protein
MQHIFQQNEQGFFKSKVTETACLDVTNYDGICLLLLVIYLMPGQKNFTNNTNKYRRIVPSKFFMLFLGVITGNSISERTKYILFFFFHDLRDLCQLNSPNFLMHWEKVWRCRGSNPRPSVCETDALPLSYIPLVLVRRSCASFLLKWPAYQIRMV